MAGRVKHMERSHKTLDKHYNMYQRRAAAVNAHKYEMSLLDRIFDRLHRKHQDR